MFVSFGRAVHVNSRHGTAQRCRIRRTGHRTSHECLRGPRGKPERHSVSLRWNVRLNSVCVAPVEATTQLSRLKIIRANFTVGNLQQV